MAAKVSPEDNLTVIDVMRRISRFDEFTDRDLRAIVSLGRISEYKEGEVIIREGDYDCWVYIMLTGTLEVVKDNRVVGHLRRNGDLFGEMGVIDGSPRSATIRALKKSLVLGFDGAIIDRKMKKHDVYFCYIVYRLFSEVLAARLRNTTMENVTLRQEVLEQKKRVAKLCRELEQARRKESASGKVRNAA